MIDRLPEGKSIGWMQAPPQWIFTHTIRFVGIVRVVIQDGEGFILIKKGKPLVYYFKHGRIELHGHGALDYFNSHPTIEFNLCKYTPEEFAQALKICNIEEDIAETEGAPEKVAPAAAARPAEEEDTIGVGDASAIHRLVQPLPVHPEKPVPAREPPAAPSPSVQPAPVLLQPEPAAPVQPAAAAPPAAEDTITVRPATPAPARPEAAVPVMPAAAIPVRPVAAAPAKPVPVPVPQERVFVPQPAVLEDPDIRIIGQIKKLNGIVAISVFNDDQNILLMGDVEIEPLLKIARTMLATTNKITPHLDWGSFVHMTLQIPEGNVIIAPYRENHLCILTTRTINIGHIRRILRDLQQDRNNGDML
jgi:hypothetical protein